MRRVVSLKYTDEDRHFTAAYCFHHQGNEIQFSASVLTECYLCENAVFEIVISFCCFVSLKDQIRKRQIMPIEDTDLVMGC